MSSVTSTLSFVRHFALILRARTSTRSVTDIAAQLDMPDPLTAPIESRISVSTEAAFVERACHAVGSIDFGFEGGLSYGNPGNLPAYLAKHAPTLREGIIRAFDYLQAASKEVDFELKENGNAAVLRLSLTDPRMYEFPRHTEALFAAIVCQAREFTKRSFHPDQLSFRHMRSPVSTKVRTRLGCDVVFGADHTEMLMPHVVLDAPMVARDDILSVFLKSQAEHELAELHRPEPGLAEKVELLLEASFPDKPLTVDGAAKALGMSRRTLSRRLQDEGISFRSALNNVRMRIASRELRDSDMPIGEIGYRLGYASQANFATAFRRETGLSPSAYRNVKG